MRIAEKDSYITSYWNELESISEYRVMLEGKNIKPLITTKEGNKIVGARIESDNSLGNLLLIPYINFNDDKYTEIGENKEYYWTDEAMKLGRKVLTTIYSLDKAIREIGDISIAPDWITQDRYVLPKEQIIRDKLAVLEKEIEKLQKQVEIHQQDMAEESVLKNLLYENGKPLEKAVHLALKIIGFRVEHYEDSEFDIILESKEGRLLGEVEGKDNKAINIGKLRQLATNLIEDLDRDSVSEMAKGILVGNAYRFKEPDERADFFTEKCIKAAIRNQTALIRSDDLFDVAKYLSNKPDERYATLCRKAIIDKIGQVKFPDLPSS
jgi:hypothetical protein